VASGTARNLFRGYRTDKILSQLDLGGKTGSISNTERSARFDWFVGYALAPDRRAGLVVSVVVAHEEYIGVRAAQYARMAMTRYFSDYFARVTLAERNQEKDSHLQ
jgi:beta-lactamase class D